MTDDNMDEISADDWGAAMAEQTSATPSSESQPAAQPHAFSQFTSAAGTAVHNDLDMIMDIPVQLTVELGRTKMPIKNLLV